MGKVTFEFDDNEERYEIDLIVKRHSLAHALDELKNFRRKLYKGYEPEGSYIYIKKDKSKVYSDEEVHDPNYHLEDAKMYIDDTYVLNEIDHILDDVWHLLD